MGYPGAGSSAGGPPAGAVVVPVEAAALAAPPAAGTTRSAWAWARVSARVTWAGAAAPPAGAAGALAVAAPAAARAPAPAWTRLSARLALAAALFLLGCAAAGLALFAMVLPTADFRQLGKACVPPTDAEVAGLRTASEYLLLEASAQMLAAAMDLLVPARPVTYLGLLLGILTGYHATDVLVMLTGCHAHTALTFHFWLFFAVLCAALLVAAGVSLR